MKTLWIIIPFASVVLLAACQTHTNTMGKIIFKTERFSGVEELGEFETLTDGEKVSLPYEIKDFSGKKATLTVRYEVSDIDGEFEQSEDILSNTVTGKEKGMLSFTAEKSGEYEVFLQSKDEINADIRLNLQSVNGGLDLDDRENLE